jgi:hypothetical protein
MADKTKGASARSCAGEDGGWSRWHNRRMLYPANLGTEQDQGCEQLLQHGQEDEDDPTKNSAKFSSNSNGTGSMGMESDGLGTHTSDQDAAQPNYPQAHPQCLHRPTATSFVFEHATILTLRQQLEEEKTLARYWQEENEELVHDNQNLVADNQEYEEQLSIYKQLQGNVEEQTQELLIEVESLQEQLLGEYAQDYNGSDRNSRRGSKLSSVVGGGHTRTASIRSLSVQDEVEDLTNHIHQRLKEALYENNLLEQRMSTLEIELDQTHTAAEKLTMAKKTIQHKCKQLEKHVKRCTCQEPVVFLPEGGGGGGRGLLSMPNISVVEAFEKGDGGRRRTSTVMQDSSNAVAKAGGTIRRRISMSFITPNHPADASDHHSQSPRNNAQFAVDASARTSCDIKEEDRPTAASFLSVLQHAASGCSEETFRARFQFQRPGSKRFTRSTRSITSTVSDEPMVDSIFRPLEAGVAGGDASGDQPRSFSPMPVSGKPSWNEHMDREKEAREVKNHVKGPCGKDQPVGFLSCNTDYCAHDDFVHLDEKKQPHLNSKVSVRQVVGGAFAMDGKAQKTKAAPDNLKVAESGKLRSSEGFQAAREQQQDIFKIVTGGDIPLTHSSEGENEAAAALDLLVQSSPEDAQLVIPLTKMTGSTSDAASSKRVTVYAQWSNTVTAGTGEDYSDLSERNEHQLDHSDDVSSLTSIGDGYDGRTTQKASQQPRTASQSQGGRTFASRRLGYWSNGRSTSTSSPSAIPIQPANKVNRNRNTRRSLLMGADNRWPCFVVEASSEETTAVKAT